MKQTALVLVLLLSISSLIGIAHCQLPYSGQQTLLCQGTTCSGETIQILNPPADFNIVCAGPQTCADSMFIITYTAGHVSPTSPAVDIQQILCVGSGACEGTTFNVDNAVGNPVITVGLIECSGDNACRNVIFEGPNTNYPTTANCVGSGVCSQCTIYLLDGTSVNCDGSIPVATPNNQLCIDQTLPCVIECEATNPNNPCSPGGTPGVIIIDHPGCIDVMCIGPDACFGLELTVNIPQTAPNFVLSFTCAGVGACKDMNVYVDNNYKNAQNIQTGISGVEHMLCYGDNACCGTTVTHSDPAVITYGSNCDYGINVCYDCRHNDAPCN